MMFMYLVTGEFLRKIFFCLFVVVPVSYSSSALQLLNFYACVLQMAATKPLTTEAIALTEKKMDMTLGLLLIYYPLFLFFNLRDYCSCLIFSLFVLM